MKSIVSIPNQTSVPDEKKVRLVAIGVSAGGLDALRAFFSGWNAEYPHSFVIIQHQSSSHTSFLTEILGTHIPLQVTEISDGMEVSTKCVYINPPRKNVSLSENRFQLDPLTPGLGHHSINYFLSSFAKSWKSSAIVIILSGAGSDGTLGIREIHSAGGKILIQAPETAQFNSMPENAVFTGLANVVAPAEDLADELIQLMENARDHFPILTSRLVMDQNTFNKILNLIKTHSGIDFKWYRRPTLIRQAAKKMHKMNCHNPHEFYQKLRNDENEIKNLSRDFLIGVTRFFRDPEMFLYLEKSVIPVLINQSLKTQKIKIWNVGCSTGEEAYSVAILLAEAMEKLSCNIKVQIFATDIDSNSLTKGAKGFFEKETVTNVAAQRLKKYFVRTGSGFQINHQIKRMVIFSKHNILSDSPFSNMSMVMCRNLLIYMLPLPQKKIINSLHYSLNNKGFLVLGPSENPREFSGYFNKLNRKWNIFRLSNQSTPRSLLQSFSSKGKSPSGEIQHSIQKSAFGYKTEWENLLTNSLESSLIEEIGWAAIYADEDYNVIHALGNFNEILKMPENVFNINLRNMMRPDILSIFSSAIRKSSSTGETIRIPSLRFNLSDSDSGIKALIKPIKLESHYSNFCFLILLVPLPKNASKNQLLELELSQTRQNLGESVEALEAANEELQCTNEELTTVNSEYQFKLDELTNLNELMDNLLKGSGIFALMGDCHLRLSWFTPMMQKAFQLEDENKGRPLQRIAPNLPDQDFIRHCRKVLSSAKTYQKEVKHSGKWFSEKILPYFNSRGDVCGVVVVLSDITQSRIFQDRIGVEKKRNLTLLNSIPEAIFRVNKGGKVLDYRPGNQATFACEVQTNHPGSIHDFFPAPVAECHIKNILKSISKNESLEYNYQTGENSHIRHFQCSLSPTSNSEALMIIRDITRHLRSTIKLEDGFTKLMGVLKLSDFTTLICEKNGKIIFHSPQAEKLFGISSAQISGSDFSDLIPEKYHPQINQMVFSPEESGIAKIHLPAENGPIRIIQLTCFRTPKASGHRTIICQDLNDQKSPSFPNKNGTLGKNFVAE